MGDRVRVCTLSQGNILFTVHFFPRVLNILIEATVSDPDLIDILKRLPQVLRWPSDCAEIRECRELWGFAFKKRKSKSKKNRPADFILMPVLIV